MFEVLLKDYGYQLNGKMLIDLEVKGFRAPRIVGKFRSAMDACEYLCPIIHDAVFTNRLVKLSEPST